MWVGEGLKEEIAGERGPWRACRAAHANIFLPSFLIVPPAVLWFTYTKRVLGRLSWLVNLALLILMANGMTKKPWWLDREGLVNLALLLGLV